MKRKKKRIVAIMAILVACCFMLNTAVFAQGILDTEETARVDRIMIAEYMVKKTIPTVSEKVIVPYQDAFGAFSAKNTAIGFTLCLDEDNRAMAVGVVQLGGTEVAFSASGDYVTGSKTRDYTVLAMLTGQMGDETITMTVSYDRSSTTSYVYLSVGKLGEYSAPLQLEFGECTENIEQVNAEVIEKNFETDLDIDNASSQERTLQQPEVPHQGTSFFTMPNSIRGAAISIFFPDSVEKGHDFDYYGKITMGDNRMLQYIQNYMDDSASGPMRVCSAEIIMESTSAYLRVEGEYHYHEEDTYTVYFPVLDSIDGSISIQSMDVVVQSLDIYREPQGGAPVRLRHVYQFGTLGICVSIDWGNKTPQEAEKGLCGWETLTYVDNGNESRVGITGTANIVAGYVGDGTRPGSRVIKTHALDSIEVTSVLMITN